MYYFFLLATSILIFLLLSLFPIHFFITKSATSLFTETNEKLSKISILLIFLPLIFAFSVMNFTSDFGVRESRLPIEKNNLTSLEFFAFLSLTGAYITLLVYL